MRFADETLAQACASRASYGAPKWQVDAWVSTCPAIAAGDELLTRLPPRSLADVLAGSQT